jgi:very-short-patch-repair endonuclease
MSPKNMIIGQRVTSEKAARARELRREMTEEERILWHPPTVNPNEPVDFTVMRRLLG